jgi:hypothetical protein
VLDGRVAGTWRRLKSNTGIDLTITPFRPLHARERDATEKQAAALSAFLGAPVALTV